MSSKEFLYTFERAEMCWSKKSLNVYPACNANNEQILKKNETN